MNNTTLNELRPSFATDLLPRFYGVLELAETSRAFASIESQLSLQDVPGLVRHRLVQFRLYPEGLRTSAVYLSVLSSGFLRTDAIPFPLKQIGVKIDASSLDAPVPSEIYIEPVSVVDARDWLRNGEALPATDGTIGYGIVLGNEPIALEHYHWLNASDHVERRIELRTNLLTGRTDRYFRHVVGGEAADIPRREGFSLWDHARLVHMIDAVGSSDDVEHLDPILIYSRKNDSAGVPHIALYLTTATTIGERMPKIESN